MPQIDIPSDEVLANRYRIIEPIGAGGMGEVFRGMDHVLERDVAIKVLSEGSDEVCRRFLLEAQSMARLNHPNIVAVYDVGVDRNYSYIILEYVRGVTLRHIDRSKISFAAAVEIALALLEALRYAHAQGVVHRDIKPSNIMLADNNILKVMDFGLARRISDVSNLTQSVEIVGTIAYLPPERFLGKPGDRGADLYSVGVLLYELLSGQLPFKPESDDLVAAMFAHVHDRPKALGEVNPLVPTALQRIVMRLLEKEPSRRYAAATAVMADLRAVHRQIDEASASLSPFQAQLSIAEPCPVYSGDGFLDSDSFVRALDVVLEGMSEARRGRQTKARHHYARAVGILSPPKRRAELAGTYARLGAMYGRKARSSRIAWLLDAEAARLYLEKAQLMLKRRRLFVEAAAAEAALASLNAAFSQS